MCGIFGYVGHGNAAEVVLAGLQRLEYRGYDSAGLAAAHGGALIVRRHAGKISGLERMVRQQPVSGRVAIAHTRWATHGRPSEANAHPHADCSGAVVVVHNGIIENHQVLKDRLIAQGHRFCSQTDTEVIAHLIECALKAGADLVTAVRAAVAELTGAYAVAALHAAEPDRIIAAKQGAGAVVVGLGEREAYLASDVAALIPYTRDVVILEDGEIAVLAADRVRLSDRHGAPVERGPERVVWDAARIDKGGYPHFMLKEIYEQPRAVSDTFQGRLDLEQGTVREPEMRLERAQIRGLRRVVLVACGTSYHAGLVGRFMIE